MATMNSYDLNGKKLSFANWISNITPTDTPFVSMTGKEKIKNTVFQWQEDNLANVDTDNAQKEGEAIVSMATHTATTERSNTTQILRKIVNVSDSANATDNYGRTKELQYQMEKASKEIKRDLEAILLSDQAKVDGSASVARKTASVQKLIAAKDATQTGTGAKVHTETATSGTITEAELFSATMNLYLAGSEANIIMFHPSHASFFASLSETPNAGSSRVLMFDGMSTKFNRYISTLVDPLGQEYRLIPNRFMPEKRIFIFNPKDWTQMILREPQRIKLDKKGSYEQYLIEMEVGLRHRNQFASGLIEIKA